MRKYDMHFATMDGLYIDIFTIYIVHFHYHDNTIILYHNILVLLDTH